MKPLPLPLSREHAQHVYVMLQAFTALAPGQLLELTFDALNVSVDLETNGVIYVRPLDGPLDRAFFCRSVADFAAFYELPHGATA